MSMWPYRSPLTWDIAAILTYTLVSLLFFWLGLLPDAAAARDRARSGLQRLWLAIGCLGWRGSAAQWRHRRHAQLVLAGLATPLVVSVHSIVSLDFAVGWPAGWHSTIFRPTSWSAPSTAAGPWSCCCSSPSAPSTGCRTSSPNATSARSAP
ncbi:MAG: hypothetical protein R3F59_27610 [Myxococcota bacterium]